MNRHVIMTSTPTGVGTDVDGEYRGLSGVIRVCGLWGARAVRLGFGTVYFSREVWPVTWVKRFAVISHKIVR